MNPDKAPEGVDVERPRGEMEERNLTDRLVNKTSRGIDQRYPTHHDREAREEKGKPEQELDRAPHREIGATDDPGEEDRAWPTDDAGCEIKPNGVPHCDPKIGIGESLTPCLETPMRCLAGRGELEAADHQ